MLQDTKEDNTFRYSCVFNYYRMFLQPQVLTEGAVMGCAWLCEQVLAVVYFIY